MPRIFLVLATLLFAATAVAAGDPDYAGELIAAARQQRLAEQQEWRDLVHYKRRILHGGYESLVDSRSFFLADGGKHDPAAELEATLRAFFSDEVESDKSQNPQCRFIARYHWLKQALGFDATRLPEQQCPRFERWIAVIDPEQITLIFPSAYLNNPSSMFGHTLFRVDMPNQDERTRLISYAINFAASTDETNGVLFAVRGLTGGYPGQFSIMPYYEKVKEYNDLENRDIWEYQLNFSHEEIMRLLRHVWEMGSNWYQYYFFDENCSYHLLTMFDVARPGMALADRFPYFAIPSDTVREVLQQEGLMRRAVYRPSRYTKLSHRLALMDEQERSFTLALANGTLEPQALALTQLAAPRRALMLESAQQYLQYRMSRGDVAREEAAPRALRLLRTRAELPALGGDTEPATPAARPDQGHGSSRLSLGSGSNDGNAFQSLRLRPAYHDLVDPQEGFIEGSQINFFDMEARYYPELARWRPERFTLLDIASLSPRDTFFKPLSWTVATGLERAPFTPFDSALSGYLRGGAGLSYRHGTTVLSYLLAEASVHAGHTATDEPLYALAPALGLFWSPGARWRSHLRLTLSRYSSGAERSAADALFEQRYTLNRDLALRLQLIDRQEPEHPQREGSLALQWYF